MPQPISSVLFQFFGLLPNQTSLQFMQEVRALTVEEQAHLAKLAEVELAKKAKVQ